MHLRSLRIAAPTVLAFYLWAGPAAAQDAASQAALSAQIDAKRMEIRHHTELMQGIQDPRLFQSETQKHFQMVEQLLALVLEQQRQMLQLGGAPPMGGMEGEDAMEMGMPPAGAPSGTTPGGTGAGMAGGMEGEDAMEMGMPPAGAAGGMGGGMMGGKRGGHETMGMGGMQGGAAPDSASMGAASSAARRIAEREALLAQIDTHLAYLSTISDPATRARETVKHQQMLDQLLASMR